MSAVVETFLLCDVNGPGCHRNFGIDNRNNSVMGHRKIAKQQGWVYRYNQDICPVCKSIPKPLLPKQPNS